MDETITQEEQDELLRASMEATESGINDSGESDTENTDDSEDDAGDDADNSSESTEETQEEEKSPPKKNKSNIAKILSERNALRTELAELKAKQGYDEKGVDFISKTAEDRANEIVDERLFFRDNPDAQEVADEIKEIAKNHNLSISNAYTLYIANTDPTRLLSEQEKNKMSSNKYAPSGTQKRTVLQEQKFSYDDAEFAEMISKGKVRL